MSAEELPDDQDQLHDPAEPAEPGPDRGGREIPRELHSVEQEGPFGKCTACGAELTGMYQIHKAYRGSECVLEMAVCFQCLQGLSSEYSEESLEAIREFLNDRGDGLFGAGMDGCGFCASAAESLRNYSIMGVCRGRFLMFPSIRVCESCEEAMQEKLSKKTRDINDGFIRDHLPGVPEDIDVNSPIPAFF